MNQNNLSFFRRLLYGFIAGFFGTLIFHQLALAVLWIIRLAPFKPFSLMATKPFGVPAVFSLSFWGGLWGIIFILVHNTFSRRVYWTSVFLFGAIFPSLVALLVVFPIKSLPMGGGWHPAFLLTAFLINGAWGIGTGLIFKILSHRKTPMKMVNET
jgi:hypothetical protein